jgi:hypothetical protein
MLRYPSKAGAAGGEEREGAAVEEQQSDDGSSNSNSNSSSSSSRSDEGSEKGDTAIAATAGPSSSSAPGTPPRLKDVCKYFVNNTGHCLRGADCPKFHPPLALLPQYRSAWVQRRAAERALASHLEGDTHDPLQDKTHKAARARVRAVSNY